jgi:hypothetical protein
MSANDLFGIDTPGRVYNDEFMAQATRHGVVLWAKTPMTQIKLWRLGAKTAPAPKLISGTIFTAGNAVIDGEDATHFLARTDEVGMAIIETHHGERWQIELGGRKLLHAGPLDVNFDGKVDESDLDYFLKHPYDWPSDGASGDNSAVDSHIKMFRETFLVSVNPAEALRLHRKNAFVETYGTDPEARRARLAAIARNRNGNDG